MDPDDEPKQEHDECEDDQAQEDEDCPDDDEDEGGAEKPGEFEDENNKGTYKDLAHNHTAQCFQKYLPGSFWSIHHRKLCLTGPRATST